MSRERQITSPLVAVEDDPGVWMAHASSVELCELARMDVPQGMLSLLFPFLPLSMGDG
jgi:hypothetical protein